VAGAWETDEKVRIQSKLLFEGTGKNIIAAPRWVETQQIQNSWTPGAMGSYMKTIILPKENFPSVTVLIGSA